MSAQIFGLTNFNIDCNDTQHLLFMCISDSSKNSFGATVALGKDEFINMDFDPTTLNDTCGTVNLNFRNDRTGSIVCDR